MAMTESVCLVLSVKHKNVSFCVNQAFPILEEDVVGAFFGFALFVFLSTRTS